MKNSRSKFGQSTSLKNHLSSQLFSIFIFFGILMVALVLASCSDDEDPVVPKTFEGNIQLATQAEVDAFVQEKVTEIAGNLVIGPTSGPLLEQEDPITDLSGLENLSRVDGDLSILRNEVLTDLNGLNGLTEVRGDLTIRYNFQLVSTYGLNELESINGDLEIVANDLLKNVGALNGLRGIRNFTLTHNGSVERLFDLSNVAQLDKVDIQLNPSLKYLSGLGNTRIIHLSIQGNESLENLGGLEGITELTTLQIRYNEKITNFEGLSGLRAIHQLIEIDHNDNLVDLSGMPYLEIGPYQMRVNGNPKLVSLDGFQMGEGPGHEPAYIFIQQSHALKYLPPVKEGAKMASVNLSVTHIDNLDALAGLTELRYLSLVVMRDLKNLNGLENLRKVETIHIAGNEDLESLDGLNGLEEVTNIINVSSNEKLNNFCALTGLMRLTNFEAEFNTGFNAFNPSLEDLKNGDCN